jgi:hypothetical protein
MTATVQRCIIVPDAWVNLGRALTDNMGPAAAGMFRVPLSKDGALPASHWISAGMIDDTFANVLPLTRYESVEAEGETTVQPVTTTPPPVHLAGLCAHLGVEPPPTETLAAMLAAIHVTESNDPFGDMARLGLVMAHEANEADQGGA